MTVSDQGFTVVAPLSGTVLVCEHGRCFALRSATKPAETKHGPWVDVDDVHLLMGPNELPVGALDGALVKAHLSDVPVMRAVGNQGLPALRLDDFVEVLAASPPGNPSVVPIHITGGMLDLDRFAALIDAARATRTRVEFSFDPDPTSG